MQCYHQANCLLRTVVRYYTQMFHFCIFLFFFFFIKRSETSWRRRGVCLNQVLSTAETQNNSSAKQKWRRSHRPTAVQPTPTYRHVVHKGGGDERGTTLRAVDNYETFLNMYFCYCCKFVNFLFFFFSFLLSFSVFVFS